MGVRFTPPLSLSSLPYQPHAGLDLEMNHRKADIGDADDWIWLEKGSQYAPPGGRELIPKYEKDAWMKDYLGYISAYKHEIHCVVRPFPSSPHSRFPFSELVLTKWLHRA